MSTASRFPSDDRELKVAHLLRWLDERPCEDSSANSLSQNELQDLDELQREQLAEASECLEYLNSIRRFYSRPTVSRFADAETTPEGSPAELDYGEMDRSETESGLPKRVGRYEIIQVLGQGGFSRVFLARDPQLDRLVALKVPTVNFLLSQESRIRFEREARAAALLDHPALVPVYETGSVSAVHFIAMAYCDGPSLDQWLQTEDNPVSPKDAVEMLIGLAGAVQHAHQRGIIHRDLKPGNILIGDFDAKTERPRNDSLRITDFGMAYWHAIEQEKLTREGALVGTPAYMAPEQARGESTIGPAADIYSLGVIFHQLLTHQLPHLGETYLQTLKMIETDEPRSLRSLNSEVPRDLDAIALKCLQKEPDKRYSSAFELQQDLQRWRDRYPVQARMATAPERLAGWAKRNPVIAASLTFAIVSLVIGIGVAGWKWREAEGEKQVAVSAKQEADQAAKRTENALGVMLRSFQRFGEEQEAEVKAVDVLHAARADLEVALKDDPLGRAKLLQALGVAFGNLSEFEPAIEAGGESVRIYTQQAGIDHAETVQSVADLATTHRQAGNLTESYRLLEATRDAVKQRLGDRHPLTLEAMENLGVGYRDGTRANEAIAVLEQVVAGRTALFGLRDPRTLDGIYALGVTCVEAKLPKQAIDLLEQERELRGEQAARDVRHHIDSLQQLARAYQDVRRLDDAVTLMNEAWEVAKASFGPDHTESLTAQRFLGFALRKARRHDECLELFEQIVQGRIARQGPLHRDTLMATRDLAVAHGWFDQLEEAIVLYEKTLELQRQQLGAAHNDTLTTMLDLVVTYRNTKRYEQAETLGVQLLKLITEAEFPDRDLEMLTMRHLAVVYMETDRPEMAMPLSRRRYEYHRTEALAETPGGVLARRQLQNLLIRARQFDEAEFIGRDWVRAMEELGMEDLHGYPTALVGVAVSLEGQGRIDEATVFAKRALEHPQITRIATHRMNGVLGIAAAQVGRLDEARELLEAGLISEDDVPSSLKFMARRSHERMIQWCELAGRQEEAEQWRKKLAGMDEQD